MRHWEATINTIFTPDVPGRIICQYSRSRLAPSVIQAALSTHPVAVLGIDICPNPFYDAPLVLDGTAGALPEDPLRVERMLSQLRWPRAFEKERAERLRTELSLAETELSRRRFEELYDLTQRTAEDLRKAVAAKDEFVGLVSHELRTPIAVILGNAQVLLKTLDGLAPDQHDALLDIRAEAERLDRIIANLLLLAKLEGGHASDLQPLMIQQILERAIAEHRRRHPSRPIQVTYAASGAPCLGNSVYVGQVIANLVSNAEKYSLCTRGGRARLASGYRYALERRPPLSATGAVPRNTSVRFPTTGRRYPVSMRSWLVASIILLVGAACSGEKAAPLPDTLPEGGARSPLSVDLDKESLADLVRWEALFFSVKTDIDERSRAIIEAMAGRPEYSAFLFDLAFLPTPYRDQIVPLMFPRRAVVGARDFLMWAEERGFTKPEDDPPQYVEFKQRLFSTIQPAIGAFLDPSATRLIAAQEVMWGGVYVDGIPPLEEPRFVTPAGAASWIKPSDQVIGVEINGDARAYPRRIIDWHEMVNDTVGGVPVSLAYCTLCGSAILYDGRHGGQVYRFGTSGMLYRSNKLMYDRNTRTLWEQYTGEPVWGPLAGTGVQLQILSTVHTTYEQWLAAHPETKVLDVNTGFFRDYGSGVAYADYWASGDMIFPAPDSDGPLRRKDWVYTVRLDGEAVAYPIALLGERGLIHDKIGDRSIVVIATADRSGGRAYDAAGLRFELDASGPERLRSADGRIWSVTESALVSEDGASLLRLPGHNSFWFAVTNHSRNWRLYGE